MKHLTNILFAFMLTLCITAFAVGQVVTTDKPDYEPGEMMLITGNDFAADEQIRVRILDLDRNTIVHEQMVQADGFGGFSLSWQNPPLLDPNDVLYHAAAEAIGTSSNLSAIAYFTDGVPTRLSSPAPGPSSGVCGATITVYATLQYKPGSPGSWGDWAPLPGKTINFTLGSSSGSGITNANGYATAQLVVPEGATLLVASFAGDGAYNPVDLQNISFTVTGTCATAPTITCPSDITVNNATGLCGAIVTFTTPATATGTPTPTISYSPISGLFFPVGTTQVTATATNSAGSDQCTFNVTVNDNEAPIPQVASLPDVTGECSVNLIAPTATDNCAGTITGTTDKMVFDEQGTFVVTWTYNDGHGNTTTQTQNVVVKDVAAPVPNIATLPNATGECSVTLTVPTATDNCAGTITGTTTDPTTYDAQGEYTVTWTYDDGNGNTISQTQNVIVKDITAPVPNVATLADVIAQCSVNLPAAPTATDNCAGTVTGVADVTGPFGQGDYTITWTYSDGNGNSSTQTQLVKVHDTQAPVPDAATLPDVIAQCSANLPTAPTATDNCAGQVTGVADVTGPFGQGDYTITWTYSDGNGNSSTQTQLVKVHDTQAPVPNAVTLPDVIAQCSVNLPTAPTATDNCAGQVTGVADVTGPFGQGNHTIMWTYSDGNGNNSTQMQWVRVHDTQAPVVTAPGAKVFPICGPFDLGSASALDNCDGALTPTNNAPPSFPLGNTAVTWSATDAAGNTGTAAQNVTVNYGSVEGFLPPMAPYPTAINIKKGRTVPVKFRLTQCPGVSNVIANISVDEASGMSSDVIAPLDVVGTSAADVGTLFRYSASDDQYIFNLSTNNMVVGKTYRIRATLADGQIIYGFVRVTK